MFSHKVEVHFVSGGFLDISILVVQFEYTIFAPRELFTLLNQRLRFLLFANYLALAKPLDSVMHLFARPLLFFELKGRFVAKPLVGRSRI